MSSWKAWAPHDLERRGPYGFIYLRFKKMERSTSYGALGVFLATSQVRGGDVLRGEAVITVRKPVKFSELQVKFVGKAKTEGITVRTTTTTNATIHGHKRLVRHHGSHRRTLDIALVPPSSQPR